MDKRERITRKLTETRERRQGYLDREKLMLSPNGIQSYGIGSRNTMRYNTDLKAIQDAIDKLGTVAEELEAALNGEKARPVRGAVPHDNW